MLEVHRSDDIPSPIRLSGVKAGLAGTIKGCQNLIGILKTLVYKGHEDYMCGLDKRRWVWPLSGLPKLNPVGLAF